MIMRLIDADELIKCIPLEEYNSRFAVMNAPTIGPQKWIPCSKEMPEIGTILVSNGLNVAFGEYYGDDVWVINGCEAEPILEEIAWMPLPEPWKEGLHEVN